ncbi:MAG TPA: sigma-70 family RNA polymerase sigma factor [Vicinamibacteria bacterium]|nr:sigma-70 family RNA polymerase sigma factor [Vicinamibacteria bacterium]
MKPAGALARSNWRMDEPAKPPTFADAGRGARDPAPDGGARADADLVERARGGEHDAFRALVDRHRDHAFGLALQITRSPEEAEDAAQEAFVRAWLALPAFRGEASFGTWLHRIVVRRALDHAVARRARVSREREIETAESLPVPMAGAERDLVLARRLGRLMEDLSPRQRAVVTLFYREDRPVQEIAAVLAMPENTVKTHLRRARAALREAWMRETGAAG